MKLCVTGTDTGVGKTVSSAALATGYALAGLSVAVYKPVQTGVLGDQAGDIDEVRRLSAQVLGTNASTLSVSEGCRLREPMAPRAAAAADNAVLPRLADHLERLAELKAAVDVVIVEGAGGLLVELTEAGETLADLCRAFEAELVVVTRPDLGTLNHTALTLMAARSLALRLAGVLIGSWPRLPEALHLSNRSTLMQSCAAADIPWLGELLEHSGLAAGFTPEVINSVVLPRASAAV
ncbi:dethiobiotin synthase [Glutamicibacter sp. PS]|uniref:dethiobiotin synthase n=1 Tax=Glutamicibacter sp. PS TaxID=3075634 RepID=UPI0028449807|nr:dethiobiotin synthase [Glutamicibacter sp. PS]MDR4534012.1 dethiobiotin synthase [Glutamicibacter sp. PS]